MRYAKWEGVLALVDAPTSDGRILQGEVTTRELPIPLRYSPSDQGAHFGAVNVGRIDAVEVVDGKVMGSGIVVLDWGEGQAAYDKLASKQLRGVSIDPDLFTVEEEEREGEYFLIFKNPRIAAATLVDIPAFAEAIVELSSGIIDSEDEKSVGVESLVASAGYTPSATWFQDPKLTAPHALTVTSDGRVFGHLALFGTCHIGFAGECISPPKSASQYAYFRTGSILTDAGEVAVGQITAGTGHAGGTLNPAATAAHYDNTGSALADVAVGEDEFGIWVAGAMRSTATDSDFATVRAASLSGDWRRIGGSMELVAALAVNVPGFPVPRAKAVVEDKSQVSLVASGIVREESAMGGFNKAAIREIIAEMQLEDARLKQADADLAFFKAAEAAELTSFFGGN